MSKYDSSKLPRRNSQNASPNIRWGKTDWIRDHPLVEYYCRADIEASAVADNALENTRWPYRGVA